MFQYMKMAAAQRILFRLLCAFLFAQEVHSQKSNYHSLEESSSSSSTANNKANYKKEVTLLNNNANAVMVRTCGVMKPLNVPCPYGDMNRRFLGKFSTNAAGSFLNMKLRTLYTVTYLCDKISRCIGILSMHVMNVYMGHFEPCSQTRLQVLKDLNKELLELVTDTLRTVYNFRKDVAGCSSSLDECIKTKFDWVFKNVVNNMQIIIKRTTAATGRVFSLTKNCRIPQQRPDPHNTAIIFGRCIFCLFKPDANVCG